MAYYVTTLFNLFRGEICIKYKAKFIISIGLVIVFSLSANSALADKSSVTIEAPGSVVKGSEITIRINVVHDGNSMFHYTKWVYVMINGKETNRWEYSWRKRPEDKNFTKEITYTVNEPIEIVAEASCNTHGSEGKVTHTVSLKE